MLVLAEFPPPQNSEIPNFPKLNLFYLPYSSIVLFPADTGLFPSLVLSQIQVLKLIYFHYYMLFCKFAP